MDSANTPAAPPPPGQHSNLAIAPTQANAIVITLIVCIVLTTPLIVLRIVARFIFDRRFWLDDVAAIIGWIGIFGHTALISKMFEHGGFKDIWNVSKADLVLFNKYYGVLEVIARVDFTVTKFAILWLFLRCFFPSRTQKTWAYWTVWAVIIFNVLYCIGLSFAVEWPDIHKGGPYDVNQDDILIVASIINVVSDLIVLVVPLISVSSLSMSKDRKAKLWAVFGVGALAMIISVARLVWQIVNINNNNITQYLVTVALLAVAEQTVGIIVCCMPVIPVFFRLCRRGHGPQVNQSTRPTPRSRTKTPVSTITRSFQQWRARGAEPLPDDIEMFGSSVDTGTQITDDNKTVTRQSTIDLGTPSTLASYNGDRNKFNKGVAVKGDHEFSGYSYASRRETPYPIGAEPPPVAPAHYHTM